MTKRLLTFGKNTDLPTPPWKATLWRPRARGPILLTVRSRVPRADVKIVASLPAAAQNPQAPRLKVSANGVQVYTPETWAEMQAVVAEALEVVRVVSESNEVGMTNIRRAMREGVHPLDLTQGDA